jgi:hypothetical protein
MAAETGVEIIAWAGIAKCMSASPPPGRSCATHPGVVLAHRVPTGGRSGGRLRRLDRGDGNYVADKKPRRVVW